MSPKPGLVGARRIDDAGSIVMSETNAGTAQLHPPGPDEPYSPTQDLLGWMNGHFERYGDIYKASIYGSNVYVINAPEYAEHVLRRNWQNYRKGMAIKRIGWLLGNGLMVSEGEFWKRQRRMIQPAFRHNAIAALSHGITAANVALLEGWKQAAQEKKSVNATHDISHMVADTVLTAIFGVDCEQVRSHFDILTDEYMRDLQFAEKFRSLGKIVSQVAAERRKRNMESADILGMLMAARDRDSGQTMPDRQLVNEIMTLIVAGHETTASTLNWIWYLLSRHPEVEKKLWKELDEVHAGELRDLDDFRKFTYTQHIINEAMRLYPPGWLMTRRALKDDHLGRYFVPAGTEIYISAYNIQRHPGLWEAADCFHPDRFADVSRERQPVTMLPFSVGPRNCVGESFARLEMQIHLITIAKHLRLSYHENKPPELDAGVNLRSKHDFVMAPEIRSSGHSPMCPSSMNPPAAIAAGTAQSRQMPNSDISV
jgi:cytochrome P450